MSCVQRIPEESNNSLSLLDLRQLHYDHLMACAGQPDNSVWLAQILSSWQVGIGALPDNLGLTGFQFKQLLNSHFPDLHISGTAASAIKPDFSRMLEKRDLEQFLNRYASQQSTLHECLITLLVTACLGNDHLWQDLGLWSRQELSALLSQFFPQLTLLNHKDMKWKKFLYKQLCEAEGIYVCRAPSCEVCKDYGYCFGAEE